MDTRAASPELRMGEEFAGHRIDGVLGRGGMGVVYQATDLRLDRVAALKVITPALSSDEDFRRRFQRESQLAASVRQQNVVTIFQAGEAEGLLFVTMELVRGSDLRAYLTEHGRLDLGSVSTITTQVAAALDAAHAAGLVHRDVKPANVLMAGGPGPLQVYLTDFGLTKRTSSQSGITKTGLFVGTIDYAAPEQIKGWPVDARADVYALGCVVFEMLAGVPPFRRENEYATMYAHTSEPAPPLSSLVAVSPALDAVVARALEKEPDARYPSAGDFARALSAAVAGQAPSEPERTVAVGRAAPPPPPPTPQGHPVYGYGLHPETTVVPPQRRSWLPVLVVVAAVLLAGGVAAAVLLGGSGDSGGGKPASQPLSQPPTSVPQGPTVAAGVAQIAGVLDLSERGRTLTIAGDYEAAIANRSKVLDRIDGFTLAARLETSRKLLRAAVQASLDADRALEQCSSCASTARANARATDLKQRFVLEFNPLATQYLHRSFDSNSL